jgi:hypothetical protein
LIRRVSPCKFSQHKRPQVNGSPPLAQVLDVLAGEHVHVFASVAAMEAAEAVLAAQADAAAQALLDVSSGLKSVCACAVLHLPV